MLVSSRPMRAGSITGRKKRAILYTSALLLLLQTIAPAFQGAMASASAGYTDTFCTMYGQITVFVAFEDQQQPEQSECEKCLVCIFQANLNATPEPGPILLESRYLLNESIEREALYLVTTPFRYRPFLSRAPPV